MCGQEECASAQAAEALNDLIAQTDDQFGGSYEIPSQPTIDLVLGEMYEDDGSQHGLDKLFRTFVLQERDCRPRWIT